MEGKGKKVGGLWIEVQTITLSTPDQAVNGLANNSSLCRQASHLPLKIIDSCLQRETTWSGWEFANCQGFHGAIRDEHSLLIIVLIH